MHIFDRWLARTHGNRLVNHPFGGGGRLNAGKVREQQRRYWSKLIEQAASGQKARPFCRERGIGEWSFYKWRRRLRQGGAVRFALLETAPAVTAGRDSVLELVLRNGERLRIGSQVDVATLRMVLETVRG